MVSNVPYVFVRLLIFFSNNQNVFDKLGTNNYQLSQLIQIYNSVRKQSVVLFYIPFSTMHNYLSFDKQISMVGVVCRENVDISSLVIGFTLNLSASRMVAYIF